MFIYAVGIAMGVAAIVMLAEGVKALPQTVALFLNSGPRLGILLAMALNLVPPGRSLAPAMP